MKLTELKSALETVGTTGVVKVIFEYPNELNGTEPYKTYPLVYWDLNSLKITGDLREGETAMTMNCFILKDYDGNAVPAIESKSRFEVWDDLMETFAAYIIGINSAATYYQLETKVDWELYEQGIISVDYELGIGYTVKLKAHC